MEWANWGHCGLEAHGAIIVRRLGEAQFGLLKITRQESADRFYYSVDPIPGEVFESLKVAMARAELLRAYRDLERIEAELARKRAELSAELNVRNFMTRVAAAIRKGDLNV